MKVLYFDCFSGISGDMTISSLIDLGVDSEKLIDKLGLLGIDGYSIEVKRTLKNGISATQFKVKLENEEYDEYVHDYHIHDHNQGDDIKHDENQVHSDETHCGHVHDHSNFAQIKELIQSSSLEQDEKNMAIAIFTNLANAEGKIHGRPAEEVHFHEVGAVDSIIDIVGAAIAINMLKPDAILCSPLPVGGGFVKSMHGLIPVPAPATAELLKGIPVYNNGVNIELVTPTGAAIVKTLVNEFGSIPEMTIQNIGYGAGSKDLIIPNVLRTYLGEIGDGKKKPVMI